MLAKLRNSIVSRPQLGLTQGHHGKLQGEASGFGSPHAAFHKVGELPEVTVAGRQFRPGITDADHRAAFEQVVWPALVPRPVPVEEAVLAWRFKPCLAAQLLHSSCPRVRVTNALRGKLRQQRRISG